MPKALGAVKITVFTIKIYLVYTVPLKCASFHPEHFSYWLNLLSTNLVSISKSEFCHFYIDLYIHHLYNMYHYFSV